MMVYLDPFLVFFITLVDIFAWLLAVWVIVYLLIYFNVVNKKNILIEKSMRFLTALYDPPLKLLRKVIPLVGGVDVSPVILLLLLTLARNLLQLARY